MSKRPYQQRLRAQAAEQTRDRILDALYDRLREAPSAPISVDEIANRAGVARSTIYLDFGSRSGLFDALTDRLLRGAGHERIVEAVADPDVRGPPRRLPRPELDGQARSRRRRTRHRQRGGATRRRDGHTRAPAPRAEAAATRPHG